MTDRAALLMDLAERCEKAQGPDRELDAEIWATAVGRVFDATSRRWLKIKRAWPANNGGKDCFWFETASSMQGTNAILYTASLDAALSLVPEGWHIALDPVFWIDGERVAYDAFCIMPMWEKWRPHEAEAWLPRVKARHAEKPLAAAAAALRALASGAS